MGLFILLYKKNNEVHQNCSNFSNTARINILSAPACPPVFSTYFWCKTSKSRFFFLTIQNVGADLKWGVFEKRGCRFSVIFQYFASNSSKNLKKKFRFFFFC